jgi:hypothetical protein
MNGNGSGNGTTKHGGLKALLMAGVLVVLLTFGAGIVAVSAAVAGVAGIAIGATAGGLMVAHGACTTVETSLARDLGLTVDELRAVDPTTYHERIAARVASKALTAQEAQVSDERADAYGSCHQVFGHDERNWRVAYHR